MAIAAAPTGSPPDHFCRMVVSRMSSGVGSWMDELGEVAVLRGVVRVSASCMDIYDFMGRLVKGKIPFISFFSYGLQIVLPLLIFGCGSSDLAAMLQSGRVVGLGGVEGRWVGPVAPDGPECGSTTTGLMSVGRGGFGFAPFQNTVTIRGKLGPDNAFESSLERAGGDKKMLTILFRARVIDLPDGSDAIEGNLVSGRCRWTVKLTRG